MAPKQSHSKNYIWFDTDVLGTGATGSVYYCRHKKTGLLSAVKTFTRYSEMRPFEVQMREFEVLQKLNHPNIVRLLDIEEDLLTRRKVIVMELCDGGSLHTILDDPRAARGLEQVDFITFLDHISAGMQHLRDQQVVHRDIKPGNILRYITDDGSFVYKLTDFGAARELEENSQFMSIYGTEEYLHPDVYERGVLRQSTGKKFSASVDLWSVGATLYHAATGHLPFRPYGGRKNKLTMHMMISQKAPGVIAGVQHYENGDIEWRQELPDTCLLSKSLRKLVTPLIRGLLETKPQLSWTFDQFFSAALKLTQKVVLYVFDVYNGKLTDIHLDPTDSFAKLQEEIAALTDISARDQLLVYENQEFTHLISEIAEANTYPSTSESDPIFLYHNSIDQATKLHLPEVPKFRSLPSSIPLEDSYVISKESCGTLHYIAKMTERSVLEQKLMNDAVKQYTSFLTHHIERVRDHSLHFRQTMERTCLLVESTQKHAGLLSSRAGLAGGLEKDLTEIVGNRTAQAQELRAESEDVCNKCEEHYAKQVLGKNISSKWRNHHPANSGLERCEKIMQTIIKESREILEDFNRLKREKRPVDAAHLDAEKIRLSANCTKALSIVESQCFSNQLKMHERLSDWYGLVSKIRASVRQLEADLNKLVKKERALFEAQNTVELSFETRVKDLPTAAPVSPRTRSVSAYTSPYAAEKRAVDMAAWAKARLELEEFGAEQLRIINAARENMDLINTLSKFCDSVDIS